MAFKSTDFKGHILNFEKKESMKQINSVEELKKEASGQNGNYVHFYIVLNAGARSSKRVAYNPETKKFNIISSELERIPNLTVELSDAQVEEVMKVINKFEEDDDVQTVYHNMK